MKNTHNIVWATALTIISVALVVTLLWGLRVNKQNGQLQAKLDATTASINQLTSSNAQSQQQCIQGYTSQSLTANALSEGVSACQAEYPTN